jgi:hypothetical protein
MSKKSYFFSVWPPVGNDCAGAMAAVASTSPKSALKALRDAHLKVTTKQPIFVESDLSLFDGHPDGAVLWRPTGDDKWIRLGS